MSLKFNKFTSLPQREGSRNALHQYLNAISDEELFSLRDEVPKIKSKFDTLVKELKLFINNHDIENIKKIVFKNRFKSVYDFAIQERNRNIKLIDGLIQKQKQSYFKGKYKSSINEAQSKVDDLNEIIINPYEKNEAFNIEHNFDGKCGTYLKEFWDFVGDSFNNSFNQYFSKEISIFKSKFKKIYYKLEGVYFDFFGPRFRKYDFDDYLNEIKTDIFDIKKESIYVEKTRIGYFIEFKVYEYLTRWDKSYYPYFLGDYACGSSQEIIDEIDVILFSRHKENVISYIKNNI